MLNLRIYNECNCKKQLQIMILSMRPLTELCAVDMATQLNADDKYCYLRINMGSYLLKSLV